MSDCLPGGNSSQQAKDLIAGMLDKDPAKRITAQEILEHPWCEIAPDLRYRARNLSQPCSFTRTNQIELLQAEPSCIYLVCRLHRDSLAAHAHRDLRQSIAVLCDYRDDVSGGLHETTSSAD